MHFLAVHPFLLFYIDKLDIVNWETVRQKRVESVQAFFYLVLSFVVKILTRVRHYTTLYVLLLTCLQI